MAEARKETARGFALDAIKRVEKDEAHVDRLADHYLQKARLKDPDRRLFSELAYGVIRHRRILDFYIEQTLDRKISQTDLTTRNILRLGAYQLFFLDKIPPRAAVNETVELSVKYARPIVNAVLRKLSENKPRLKSADDLPELMQRLGVKYSHPDWMVERFVKQFGEESAEKFMSANNQKADLCLRVNTMRANRDDLLRLLEKERIKARPGRFCPLAVVVEDRGHPADLPGYKQGLFAVQDEASQLVVMMLTPKPGERVLDACAAPGTKTLEIFQLMQKKGTLVCADVNETRLRLVRPEAQRLGLEGFEMLVQDLTGPLAAGGKEPELFDKILIDAPCSGLGTIRRHPEIKWQRSPADISKLADLQKRLMKNLSRYLSRGGTLVYSTCTITGEENQEVVSALTDSREFGLDDPFPHLPESARPLVKKDVFQTLPHLHSADGFTAFRLRRVR